MFLLLLMRHPEPDPQLLGELWGGREAQCHSCLPWAPSQPKPSHGSLDLLRLRELSSTAAAFPLSWPKPLLARWGFLWKWVWDLVWNLDGKCSLGLKWNVDCPLTSCSLGHLWKDGEGAAELDHENAKGNGEGCQSSWGSSRSRKQF